MDCPICGFEVSGPRGLAAHFRHNADTHPDYKEWVSEQKWTGKIEGQDYVTCLECGHRAKALQGHLQKHGLTAETYRAKYGSDAPVRANGSEAKRRRGIRASHAAKPRQGLTKVLPCSSCGDVAEVSAFVSGSTTVCAPCKQKQEDARWEGKSEPDDYVTCVECGYRAENLTSHLQHEHPGYRKRHPDAMVVALGSAVRDKTSLQGRTLSEETRQKMSENAGRWNAGLTKGDHPSIAAQAEKMQGRSPWSKGLSASEDARLARAVKKLKTYVGENRPWHNGLRAELTLSDFKPFMDAEGKIDRRAIVDETGLSWRTIFTYMQTFDLETSDKYVKERAEEQTIRLDKEVLERGLLGNGKVSVARVMRDTGHSFPVVKRECARHGLETFNRRGQQTLCLDAVSEALGGVSYEDEWESRRFTNPVSGRMFRFDGYFKDVGLIVEYHGHQHFMFPNAYMIDESYEDEWKAMLERDRVKREQIEAAPDLTYMEIRYDEPCEDVSYLRGRLFQLGVL